MKSRILVLAGGVAALGALGMIPAHAAVNPASGCSVPEPTPGGSISGLPSGAPNVYAQGNPTSATGDAGISGQYGYLQAGGSPTTGASVSGQTYSAVPGPGLAGSLNVSSSPSVCIGTNSASVSAP